MSDFRIDTSNINLDEFKNKTLAALGVYGDSVGKKMESYAKSNRRWQDRTGQARQRLYSQSKIQNNTVKIEIGQGVDYGVYLELANERKNAILLESIETIGPEAVKGFRELFK